MIAQNVVFTQANLLAAVAMLIGCILGLRAVVDATRAWKTRQTIKHPPMTDLEPPPHHFTDWQTPDTPCNPRS